jgi:serine/threonine-protein kinase
MQDVLRELLKRRGYRVLVIGSADRALQRFSAEERPAECVIFCTTELGQSAIDAFNRFGESPATQAIPAILFLDENRIDMASRVKQDGHRVLLPMPFKVRQLRKTLLKLLSSPAENSAGE